MMSQHCFKLLGVAERPLALDTIKIHTQAKKRFNCAFIVTHYMYVTRSLKAPDVTLTLVVVFVSPEAHAKLSELHCDTICKKAEIKEIQLTSCPLEHLHHECIFQKPP